MSKRKKPLIDSDSDDSISGSGEEDVDEVCPLLTQAVTHKNKSQSPFLPVHCY